MPSIPLLDYWTAKAYPEGEPDWLRVPIEDANRGTDAWRAIRLEAAAGKITIKAFRHVITPEWRGKYPDFPASNLLEQIPPAFFDRDDVMIGPWAPVTIYYLDPALGGPLNAPWRDPVVVVPQEKAKAFARTMCFRWLCSERRRGSPTMTKPKYAEEAFRRFGVTDGAFRTVWKEADDAEPNSSWGQPGAPRKSGKIIEQRD